MTPVVIDADAINCLRSFGLLGDIARFVVANPTTPNPLLCVGYVARHELNPICEEIERLEALGVLEVVDAARTRLVAWSDDRGSRWRPRDFEGVEPTLRRRYGLGFLVGFADR
jgi:hypothetical protein